MVAGPPTGHYNAGTITPALKRVNLRLRPVGQIETVSTPCYK
jgi:hypothetical protein